MTYGKGLVAVILGGFALLIPTAAEAGSGYGFSISTGGPGYYAPPPPPVYYAPPPPPVYYRPAPVYYGPAYGYPSYYRPAPAFNFSFYGN